MGKIHFAINYISVEYHLKAYHNYEHTLAKRPVKIWVYLEKNSSWLKIYQWKVSLIPIGKISTLFKHWARIRIIPECKRFIFIWFTLRREYKTPISWYSYRDGIAKLSKGFVFVRLLLWYLWDIRGIISIYYT